MLSAFLRIVAEGPRESQTIGHGLCVSAWLFRLAVVIQVIRSQTFKGHAQPPSVVPALELGAQEGEMVESLDQRDTFEPLVFERLDETFCDGNRSVCAYGSETRLDVPRFEQFGKGFSKEDRGLV